MAAVRALTEETHEDHTIATQPLLVLLDEPPIGIRDQPWAAVRVRNVGNGPALHLVVWMLPVAACTAWPARRYRASRARSIWHPAISSSPVPSRTCSTSVSNTGTSTRARPWSVNIPAPTWSRSAATSSATAIDSTCAPPILHRSRSAALTRHHGREPGTLASLRGHGRPL